MLFAASSCTSAHVKAIAYPQPAHPPHKIDIVPSSHPSSADTYPFRYARWSPLTQGPDRISCKLYRDGSSRIGWANGQWIIGCRWSPNTSRSWQAPCTRKGNAAWGPRRIGRSTNNTHRLLSLTLPEAGPLHDRVTLRKWITCYRRDQRCYHYSCYF